MAYVPSAGHHASVAKHPGGDDGPRLTMEGVPGSVLVRQRTEIVGDDPITDRATIANLQTQDLVVLYLEIFVGDNDSA
jgi:hypothetical protein